MSFIRNMADRYYAITILQMLAKPFTQWDAFNTGIIDASGNLIKKARTEKEKDSYTRLIAVLRRIKQVTDKFPGGAMTLAKLSLTKKFLTESDDYKQLLPLTTILEDIDDDRIYEVVMALIGESDALNDIFEEMVSGDAGGNAEKIAKGVNSGAITYAGPSDLTKKKKLKKEKE